MFSVGLVRTLRRMLISFFFVAHSLRVYGAVCVIDAIFLRSARTGRI
jgi:hypothetical protein